ncbi:MAG: flagellar FliJ family protein [Zymomonas mobilis subsp. pomaceae]|uniref:Uncharacterized protein n=1 Tax=Zymomonas mobilis subsp. pomaceae (strain ATCC 29192 / DSM 22645 / JCM 10191 / CCUG 17912 / NBRC 13757 / NCIMB 11200 / NRRL B-4491 / Barker I) TaxID=579138 RepID=F8ERN3_ZYMMT|nr:flagellar FliJ family protein [Zymomonas mobilis]AEI37491.1 hypothetical protein Zymop_0589 [Zymomonas mobilis subsp. pomaceae ATCC 29192]MDX5948859.1 flagellar FliJ family protein [Zymomonas mobilis subsp. pomaceae]GEB88666.1 hypothetical protein ZMO02_03030 [Zymomonas mobilis subsp. pomaceae]
MKQKLLRRERIARVRHIQHVQAQNDLLRAEGRVNSLVASVERLTEIQDSLTPVTGRVTGATMANAGELMIRLNTAYKDLTNMLTQANHIVARQRQKRIETRIQQETAEKLRDTVKEEAEKTRERRLMTMTQPRSFKRGEAL